MICRCYISLKNVFWIVTLGVLLLAPPVVARADCESSLLGLGQQVDGARQSRDLVALHNTSLQLLQAVEPCYKAAQADRNLEALFYDEAELELALSGLTVSEGKQSPPGHQDLNGANALYSRMTTIYNVMVKQAANLTDPDHGRQLASTRELLVETRQAAGI
jgi:hypothetical protein